MRKVAPAALIAAFAAWIFVSGAAHADDPPAFRQGLWQFDRTVGGQKLQTRECTSPSEELRRQNELLSRKGCALTPTQRSGDVYMFAAECTIDAPGAAPVIARSTSVMTVESDSGYRVEISTTGAGTSTQESLIARRIGDCTK